MGLPVGIDIPRTGVLTDVACRAMGTRKMVKTVLPTSPTPPLFLYYGHEKLKVDSAHLQRVAVHPCTPSKNENEKCCWLKSVTFWKMKRLYEFCWLKIIFCGFWGGGGHAHAPHVRTFFMTDPQEQKEEEVSPTSLAPTSQPTSDEGDTTKARVPEQEVAKHSKQQVGSGGNKEGESGTTAVLVNRPSFLHWNTMVKPPPYQPIDVVAQTSTVRGVSKPCVVGVDEGAPTNLKLPNIGGQSTMYSSSGGRRSDGVVSWLMVVVFFLSLCGMEGVAAAPFTVTSGSDACELVDNNTCVQTVNYPSNNASSKTCTVAVNRAGNLNVVGFNVETCSSCGCDFLTVNGTKYCGTTGPSNVAVDRGDTMAWRSNGSEVGTGFKICHNDCAGISVANAFCTACSKDDGTTYMKGKCVKGQATNIASFKSSGMDLVIPAAGYCMNSGTSSLLLTCDGACFCVFQPTRIIFFLTIFFFVSVFFS
jgi:hypothetical protein